MTEVIISAGFRRLVKPLRKKYPNIMRDLEPLVDELASGATPGDQIQDVVHIVYKVRVPNRDAQRGKSGGYRVIYYVKTAEKVYLLIIYSKSESEDIPRNIIVAGIEEILDLAEPEDEDETHEP